MNARRWHRWISLLLAIVLIATACGDDDSGGVGTTGSSTTVGNRSTAGEPATEGEDAGLPPRPLAERATITLSVVAPLELYSQLYLAEAFGEFERENLEVRIETIPSADAVLQLAAGNLDACMCSFGPGLFNAIATGMEARAVGSMFSRLQDGVGVYVRPDLADGQPENLKGATLAISGGYNANTAILDLRRWLEPHGMTIEDIKPLAVAPADAFLALKSGEVEAAYLLAPFYAQAVEDDLGVLVPETAPVYNNLGAGIFLGPKLLGEKADVGRAFVRAIARTTRLYLQGDYKGNDDVVSALADKLGVTVDDVRATEEMQWDPDLTMDAWPEQIEKVQELWRGLEGDILAYSDTLTADDMLAPEVMKAVLAGE